MCADAFIAGYQRHDEHLTVEAAEAVLWYADLIESAGDAVPEGIFGLLEAEGEQHALWNQLYLRQDRLILEHDRKVRDWTLDFCRTLPFDKFARALLDAVVVPQEGGISPETRQRRRLIAAAALAFMWFHLGPNTDAQKALTAITVYAMTEGAAEGYVSAAAEMETAAGRELPDLDDLRAKNLAKLLKYRPFWGRATALLQKQIDALAGDLGIHIGSLIANGASFDEIEAATKTVTKRGDGVAFWLAHGIQAAYSDARLSFMRAHGVTKFDWVTAGDAKVCAICLALEADGPYPADSVPLPPEHAGCRCILVASKTKDD